MKIEIYLDNNNIMVNTTEMAKFCSNNKNNYRKLKPTRWTRTVSCKNLIQTITMVRNKNSLIIISDKNNTIIDSLLAIDYSKWLGNIELINNLLRSLEFFEQNNAPERCTYYGEEFIDFCYDFVDLVGEEELLKNFECFESRESNYPYYKSNIGETTKFYIPLERNKLIKLDKTDILGSINLFDSFNILKTIQYLDSILEKDDVTYIRFKYQLLNNLNYKIKSNINTKNQKTYLMKDSNTGLIKIGKAIDPKFRERTLQSEKPTISLFAICNNLIEDELHKKYNDKRIRGEWFKLSEDEVSDIIKEYNFR